MKSRTQVLLLPLLISCGHSEPFVIDNYAPAGPRIPGAESRIAGGTQVAGWTDDGKGILYTTDCLGIPLFIDPRTRDTGRVSGMELLPASGGSVIWERCESREPLINSADTTELFPAVALGTDGRLLYAEGIGRIDRVGKPSPFPVNWHAELWLGDSAGPFTARRFLYTLYRNDAVGRPTVGHTDVNWVTNASWIDQNTFTVIGHNILPSGIDTTLGLMRGVLNGAGAALTVIPGTDGVIAYSVAEHGTTVIMARDTALFQQNNRQLFRVGLDGSGATLLATIPGVAGREILDVSCRTDMCLVLTHEPNIGGKAASGFFTVMLADGAVTFLRAQEGAFRAARLSPTANLVVVVESDGLHLFSELVH